MIRLHSLRRGLTVCLVLSALVFTVPVLASAPAEPTAVKRIYMVLWRGVTEAERGFMDALMNQPQPVEFIIRDAAKSREQLAFIREDIKRQRPDLVYSFGTTVTSVLAGPAPNAAAEQGADSGPYIRGIPLVFNIVADPKGAGIVSNYQHPERNVTGTSHLVPMPTQVAAMQELGEVQRIAVIFNPKEQNSTLQVQSLQQACDEAGLELIRFELPSANDSEVNTHFAAFSRLLKAREVDMTYLPSDSFLISHAKALVSASHGQGVPVFSATEGPIRKAGAYMGLVSRYYNVGQFAAYKAQQLLFEGKAVADVPVETLKRFTFIVNMQSAKALDQYPPVTIMQAAEVVSD